MNPKILREDFDRLIMIQESMSDDIDVLRSYIDTALWSSMDDLGHNLDDKYDITDVDMSVISQARKDLELFFNKTAHFFKGSKHEDDVIAHDFWLTRNYHGAGFWDGDYDDYDDLGDEAVRALTDLSQSQQFGMVDLYVGDAGKIYS